MTCEKSADNAGDHQNREVPENLRGSGDRNGNTDLPDVVENCSDYAQKPEPFNGNSGKSRAQIRKQRRPPLKLYGSVII